MMPSFFGFRKPKGLSIKSAIFFSMKKKKKKERPSTTSMISQRTTTSAAATSTSKNDISPFARAYDHDLATKFSDNVVNDLELLLSMETQARMDALEARKQQQQEEAAQAAAAAVKSRRLTFELPTKPIIPSSSSSPSAFNSNNNNNNNNNNTSDKNNNRRGSLGSIYSTTSNDDYCCSSTGGSSMSDCSGPDVGDDKGAIEIIPVHMNARVRLIRRPLPTYGYVRFIGHVDFAPGQEWVGIELDSRVGKNDGSVKGKRYFNTDRDRGIFALKENLEVIV